MTARAKKTTVIVLPRCQVGLTGYLNAREGDRIELDPDDAKGLIKRGLVRLAPEEQQ